MDLHLQHHRDGIHSLDSGYVRPRLDAVHIIVESGRAAIVDTGPGSAAPRVLAALEALGLAREAVDWIVLTHVHLDHAGAAGHLMAELPSARLAVHPRGARHMIDPSKLWAATVAVYGREEAVASHGELVPVPESRVVELDEGAAIELAGRRFEAIDAPGHARHHLALRDTRTGALFCGDTFGIAYPELASPQGRFVFPTTTPSQFDPEALKATIRRIAALQPEHVYLTHYAEIGDVARTAADLERMVDTMVAIARTHAGAGAQRQGRIAADISAMLRFEARAFGVPLPGTLVDTLVGMDVTLNAQGLVDWLDRTGA